MGGWERRLGRSRANLAQAWYVMHLMEPLLKLLTQFTRPFNNRYGSINRSYCAGYTEAHQRSWNQDRGARYKKCSCAVQSSGNRKRCRTSRCRSGTNWLERGPLDGNTAVACNYNESILQPPVVITLRLAGHWKCCSPCIAWKGT